MYETQIAVVLIALLLFFSLDFDKTYAPYIDDAARHPFARFLAGLGVVYVSSQSPVIGILSLAVVFFWIADINLLSSYKI